MAVTPTLEEVKQALQIPVSTTIHDAYIASLIAPAVAELERLSGRTISASSNVETVYSTDGASALVIHDRPWEDASRTVTLEGTALTGQQDYWFLQDRRSPHITAMIQLRAFTGSGEWYKADPMWWDKNLDYWNDRFGSGTQPSNLAISGIIGMPILTDDTWHAIREMTAYLFRLKDAAGNTAFTPQGVILDLSDLPSVVQQWIGNWQIRTAVAAVR